MESEKFQRSFGRIGFLSLFLILILGCRESRVDIPAANDETAGFKRSKNFQAGGVQTRLAKKPRPLLITNCTTARFRFSCNQPFCVFECKLDSRHWKSCSSPKGYRNLADGVHTFKVRARDWLGNADPTPAGYKWTIDTIAPETGIVSHPPDPNHSPDAEFAFECTEPECAFECQMDSAGWSTCESPKDYSSLSAGSHLFQVRAADPAGNLDPSPAAYSWTIDLAPETIITSGPANPSNSPDAILEFTCNEAVCTYECQLDSGGWGACVSPKNYQSWTAISTVNAPSGRNYHSAIWTGTEMIVWGGYGYGLSTPELNNGGRYNAGTNSWQETALAGAPAERRYHTAVWTGSEMIVWGGNGVSSILNTGGKYDPSTDSWRAASLLGAPSPRKKHAAIWTGTEMVIWGGYDGPNYFNTGARYNPTTDSWNEISTANAPSARRYHTAVWTGTEMMVWGGNDGVDYFNTGGRYNPLANTWIPISTGANCPLAREGHAAVWTGTEMIIWGGYAGAPANTGAGYNPDTDSWSPTSTTNAPSPRYYHTAVWTGTEMIIWGGYLLTNTGGRYDPETDSWIATSTTNAPSARDWHTALWTGTEMIIWGGWEGTIVTNTGGGYNPSANSWNFISVINAPLKRYYHTAVWTGTEMIIWGGINSDFLNTGGKYNPEANSWAATDLSGAPSVREDHTMVWTGSEMIVWGGFNSSAILDTGARYDPATDSWIQTSTTNAPPAKIKHTAVWTGAEMIVWGGQSYNTLGGRYNPSLNSWTPTSTVNAPSIRASHSAVWTGNEMIIWGGAAGATYDQAGGRYNPQTNSWTPTSVNNAPGPRKYLRAVWTGTEMMIWGGYYYDGNYNFPVIGGRYNPALDSWTLTSTVNAPSGRYGHSAVWTGTEMIVWGGYFYDGMAYFYNTGARYNPLNDFWTLTSTANAPSQRQYHTAVWTGTEMLIWGGGYAGNYEKTGGKYNPSRQLSEGAHLFEVRAFDLAGNADPSPAACIWTIQPE